MPLRVSSPVLIGRTDELSRLESSLASSLEGRGGAILVAGEAGVGKTRLLAELMAIAEARGATVLVGGCLVLGDGALPYAPLAEALRALTRTLPPDELEAILGAARPELARLVPGLGAHAIDATLGLALGSGQGRLFELLLGVLERLAARAPVVFVVEDLHWSDQSTRDLLAFLVRNLRDAPVLLVLTYRSDELHRRHPLLPFLAELERSGRSDRIEVRPLDRPGTAAQLRAIAGPDVHPALVESIHQRSGGNPFYAEELLAAADRHGGPALSSTLRDVLLARVADLGDATQEFLRVASAAGQRVDPVLLAVSGGLDDEAVYHALREAVARQVLVPDPNAGVERYAFRHALLQEAVYDDLLPGERTRLHSAFAQALEARGDGDAAHAAEVAYHWYAAHDLPRAFETAVVAAVAAEASYAFPEAVAHYERALELWDRVPEAERRAGMGRVDLLAALAGVARFHEPSRAVDHIQAAIALSPEDQHPTRRGLLFERLGRYAWIAGLGGAAHDAYLTAMRLIPGEPPSAARARAIAGLAQILMLGGRYPESLERAEEALGLARAVGARDIEGHAQNTRGLSRSNGGEIEEGIADLRAALGIAEETGIVDDIGRAYANWIWVLEAAGRLEEAVALAEVGVARSERLGLMRMFGAHLLCGEADYLYRLGRWEESERAVRRAEHVGPVGVNAILTEELLGRLAVARGRFDEAAERLVPLAPLAQQAIDIQFVIPVFASLAELALWQGRPDDALGYAQEAIRLVAHSAETRIGDLYALGIRAGADAAERARVGRAPAAERAAINAGENLLDGARRRHADVLERRPALAHLSAASLLACEAEASRLWRRPDPSGWRAAAEAWEAIPRPYPAAYARLREAEAIVAARGDRTVAAAALEAARQVATRLAAAPLLREVAALASRARLPVTGPGADAATAVAGDAKQAPDVAAGLGLTGREREVLGLLALGRTNRQIGETLFISSNTAGVHVSHIIGKLGVASRGEAASVAYRLGLVDAGAAVATPDLPGSADLPR
ncbi:MAG TPA: AAA family ATPase [Candidatus Limnocylindrales bacterium]|nr:AAA family ATPase [Candidatus Limnocylindrales bacterium]